MSTEHQQYSTENQRDVIRQWAEKRGFVVIRTYEDGGKSGLGIAGRDALQRLIEDVQSGRADFDVMCPSGKAACLRLIWMLGAGVSPVLGQETTMTAAESEVPMPMKKVYRLLARWRSQRTGRSKIPASIWTAAGELAREHGVSRVAEVLGLEFNQLKRMSQDAGLVVSKRRARPPAFVELIVPQPAGGRPCVIEIEGERGKLRVELNGTADELASVSRALWEMLA